MVHRSTFAKTPSLSARSAIPAVEWMGYFSSIIRSIGEPYIVDARDTSAAVTVESIPPDTETTHALSPASFMYLFSARHFASIHVSGLNFRASRISTSFCCSCACSYVLYRVNISVGSDNCITPAYWAHINICNLVAKIYRPRWLLGTYNKIHWKIL